MADANKGRGTQLLRTDDSIPGMVRFFDRRVTDVKAAYIAQVDVSQLDRAALLKAAVHGITQNILDSSNKLEGDARVAFVKKACTVVQNGGWSSTPVDEDTLRKNAIEAFVKMGLTRAAAEAAVAAATKK